MAGKRTSERRTYGRVISVLLTDAQHRACLQYVRRKGQSMSTYLRALAVADLEQAGLYRVDDDPDLRIDDEARGTPEIDEARAMAEIDQAEAYGAGYDAESDVADDEPGVAP